LNKLDCSDANIFFDDAVAGWHDAVRIYGLARGADATAQSVWAASTPIALRTRCRRCTGLSHWGAVSVYVTEARMRLVAEPGVRRFASAFLTTPPFAGSIVSSDAICFFEFHADQLG
jgi:hypothetical protein